MIVNLTEEALSAILPGAYQSNIRRMFGPLNFARITNNIDTPVRVAAFIATTAYETGAYKWMKELWGPTAQQLRYDPPSSLAATLGNVRAGQGNVYRGRGLIMVTGLSNYMLMQSELGIDCVAHPELLEAPLWAALSSGVFWSLRSCNRAADIGGIEAVTKIVNGGLTGIEARTAIYDRALDVLK